MRFDLTIKGEFTSTSWYCSAACTCKWTSFVWTRLLPIHTFLWNRTPQIPVQVMFYRESLIIEYTSIALGLLSTDNNTDTKHLQSSRFPWRNNSQKDDFLPGSLDKHLLMRSHISCGHSSPAIGSRFGPSSVGGCRVMSSLKTCTNKKLQHKWLQYKPAYFHTILLRTTPKE